MKPRPHKRHAVTIRRPVTVLGTRGQLDTDTQPLIVAKDVPCSIENLNGRELEYARQIVADATKRVRLFDDPAWSLTSKDYLEFGSRRLNIGYVDHPDEIELEAVLLCAEAV